MNNELIAKASVNIKAPLDKVWTALVNPEIIKQYMFGADVITDWKKGSSIKWKGVWDGKPYEDKGTILKIEPESLLKFSHFSPLNGLRDVPENYHTLTYKLSTEEDETRITLTQDNNLSEKDLESSQKMWSDMLAVLKTVLEK